MAAGANQCIAFGGPGNRCPCDKINTCFETIFMFREFLQTVPWASDPPEYHPQVVVNLDVELLEEADVSCRA